MHEPESWGLVMFADASVTLGQPHAFVDPVDFEQRGFLRAVYEAQRAFRARHGSYSAEAGELGIRAEDLGDWELGLALTPSGFQAGLSWQPSTADGAAATRSLRIDQLGHLW